MGERMNSEKNKKEKERTQWQSFLFISNIGMEAVISIGLCTYGGRWADAYFSSGKTCTVSGIILGFVIAIWSVYKRFQKI